MNRLRRLEDGPFRIEAAVALEALLSGATELQSALLPLDYPLSDWPVYRLRSEQEETSLWHGRSLPVDYRENIPQLRIHNRQGELAGIGRIEADNGQARLIPLRVFH